jgi:hypothetical protein
MSKEAAEALETARGLLETVTEDIRLQEENIEYLQELLLGVKDDNIHTQYMQRGILMFNLFTDKITKDIEVLEAAQDKLYEVANADD